MTRKLSGSKEVPSLSCSNLISQDLQSKFTCSFRHGLSDKTAKLTAICSLAHAFPSGWPAACIPAQAVLKLFNWSYWAFLTWGWNLRPSFCKAICSLGRQSWCTMAHPKRTRNTHPQAVLLQGLWLLVTNKPNHLSFVTKLPNCLIFQADDLPCIVSSFSLFPCMQLMTLCRVIVIPGFTHLTLSISDLGLPSHSGLQPHRSQQHSSILGAILRLNGSPQEGPVLLWGLPHIWCLTGCERADVMWDASPGLTSIWSLLPKYLLTFLNISIWKKTGTSRSQEHKWLGCPDPHGAPDLISKYMSSFIPWHKVVTLHCWMLFFWSIFFTSTFNPGDFCLLSK